AMGRPKKKNVDDNPLRRLTRSMSMKLSDLPAVPLDKILDRLTSSTSYAGLTSKYWKGTVDEFLTRRIHTLYIENGRVRQLNGDISLQRWKKSFRVFMLILEENIPLHPYASLRKTGVKRTMFVDHTMR
ncbi:hypothetical protein PRIPAC_83217, partial [Pristionchus pacificus]|uniref:Uncharacterized protein n=1 Tax=Pristionchus pacificus TaxID=54126 RepID=A0A2A6BUY7_PRIPA